MDPGGFPIDSPPPYGVSPCGHGTFVPVQTTYKPSVVLLILGFGRKAGRISLRRKKVQWARCGLPGGDLSEAWAITHYRVILQLFQVRAMGGDQRSGADSQSFLTISRSAPVTGWTRRSMGASSPSSMRMRLPRWVSDRNQTWCSLPSSSGGRFSAACGLARMCPRCLT